MNAAQNLTTLDALFADVLNAHLNAHDSLVIALSGGLDSCVLLTLAARYRQQFGVTVRAVHVHHGISVNADDWAKACQRWSAELNIECVVERVCLDFNSGESLEQQARDARYQALSQHVDRNSVLLTGQHSDDQLETFLLALKRGSGPKGLSAMPVVSTFAQGRMLRPLLRIARQDLEQFASQLQLNWVEDESNQDTRFDRNFLRHEVVPNLTERWPSFAQSVARSAQLCAEQEALLDELLASQYQACVQQDGSLAISSLQPLSDPIRMRIMRQWFAAHGAKMPSLVQLETLWREVASAQQDANPSLQLAGRQVRRFAMRLYLVSHTESVTQWQHALALDTPLMLPDGLGELQLRRQTEQATLRLPQAGESWQVVFEPEGLSAHPTTRGHSRKLKKLFQEYQVPSWLRRRTPIVLCDGKVVAVAGLFVDCAFAGKECELIWRK